MLFSPLESSKLAAKRAKSAAAAAAKEKEGKKAAVKKEPNSKEEKESRGRDDSRQRRPSSTDKQAVRPHHSFAGVHGHRTTIADWQLLLTAFMADSNISNM